MREWELYRTLVGPKETEKLNTLLDDGWEPFAASPAGQRGDVYYFRRKVYHDYR